MEKDEWMELVNEAVKQQPHRQEELVKYSLNVLEKIVDATVPEQMRIKRQFGYMPDMNRRISKMLDEHLPELQDLIIKGDTKKEFSSQISEITTEDPENKSNRQWRQRQLVIAREERKIDNAKSFPEKMLDSGADITEDDPQLEVQRKRREYLAQWDKKIEKAKDLGFDLE